MAGAVCVCWPENCSIGPESCSIGRAACCPTWRVRTIQVAEPGLMSVCRSTLSGSGCFSLLSRVSFTQASVITRHAQSCFASPGLCDCWTRVAAAADAPAGLTRTVAAAARKHATAQEKSEPVASAALRRVSQRGCRFPDLVSQFPCMHAKPWPRQTCVSWPASCTASCMRPAAAAEIILTGQSARHM